MIQEWSAAKLRSSEEGNVEIQVVSKNNVPEHVPDDLVRDFNHFTFSPEDEDAHLNWARVVNNDIPLFFTPHFGGYWVINDARLLEDAFPDWELFSSAHKIGVPPTPDDVPHLLPIEADDPYHKQLRRPLNLALSPKGVIALAASAKELVAQLVDEIVVQGHCEFVHDFSLKMPMDLFLRMVNLPAEDRETLIALANTGLKAHDEAARLDAMRSMNAYLHQKVVERLESPGDDLMSAIITMDIDGRKLTIGEQVGYMTTALFGGLDTVGGMMAMTARHLARNPDHRKLLVAHPEKIPDMIEEVLRRYAISTVSRFVTRDVEFGGVQLKQGDRIMLPTPIHGIDESRWDNALEVQLDRKPTDHMAFGKGTHRCPGAILARAELRIFVEEWLKRIPDFAIDESRGGEKWETGTVLGLKSLPLHWQA
ncbi:cytochrome P450 [Sphingobium sp. HBC34]|uniref:Cytochrome P450 n=1 Tax=Sphingobium cyanobacteriorum TaxID=3063954 RepID=A0ABT8ZQV8_9SPHN|nr:cytochrome P450 [Sphingobium sp. HBC34]MDO7836587.1 cytochrome P450 [Sphingobium sp. HBC34]